MAKRVMALLVLTAVLLGSWVPALAESVSVQMAVPVRADVEKVDESAAKVSKDKALEIAKAVLKEKFEVSVDEKKSEINTELTRDYDLGRGYVWEIAFNLNSGEQSVNMQVSVNAQSGRVVRMSRYQYSFRPETPITAAAITQAEAEKIADKFLQQMNPDEYKQLKYIKDDAFGVMNMAYTSSYAFRYMRIINGLEFDRNYVMINVDGVSGKVSSYSFVWNDIGSVPDKSEAIDKSNAEENFKSGAQFILQYIPVRGRGYFEDPPREVRLAYGLDYTSGNILDAKSGKPMDYAGKEQDEKRVKDLSDKEREELFNSAAVISKPKGEINKETAEKLLLTAVKGLYGTDYEIEALRYSENEQGWGANGKKTWMGQFYKKDDKNMNGNRGTALVDAMSGALIYVDKFDVEEPEKDFQPKVSWEEAYARALKAVARYMPDRIRDIQTKQNFIDNIIYLNNQKIVNRVYYFSFPRTVDGIAYGDNSINVEVDAKNGEVKALRGRWTEDLKFPDSKGIIEKEAAFKTYFENYQPELFYTAYEKSENDPSAFDVRLAYRLKSVNPYSTANYIDAHSGKPLNYLGQETDGETDGTGNSLKGHWAEKEISILHSHGILEIASFKPDAEATRLDAVKMLVSGKSNRIYSQQVFEPLKFKDVTEKDPDYKILQMAVNYKIIDNTEGEFKGGAGITREELAGLLVRLIQYDRLAAAEEIFKLPYGDSGEISRDKVGAVAICKGLGIMEGSKGKFRPGDNTTMAELAVAVYKALTSIKSN